VLIPDTIIEEVRARCLTQRSTVLGIAYASPDTWVVVDFSRERVPAGATLITMATWRRDVPPRPAGRVVFLESSLYPDTPRWLDELPPSDGRHFLGSIHGG
jgi:hypothetical protein